MYTKVYQSRSLLSALLFGLLSTSNAASINRRNSFADSIVPPNSAVEHVAPAVVSPVVPPNNALEYVAPAIVSPAVVIPARVAPAVVEGPPNAAIVDASHPPPAPTVAYEPLTSLPIENSTGDGATPAIRVPSKVYVPTAGIETITTPGLPSVELPLTTSTESPSSEPLTTSSPENIYTTENATSTYPTNTTTESAPPHETSTEQYTTESAPPQETSTEQETSSESYSSTKKSSKEHPTYPVKVASTSHHSNLTTKAIPTPSSTTIPTTTPPQPTYTASTPIVIPVMTQACFNANCTTPDSDLNYEQTVTVKPKKKNLLDKIEGALDANGSERVGPQLVTMGLGIAVGLAVGVCVF